jgi:hypothetical protein
MSDVRNAVAAAEADGYKIAVLSEEPILQNAPYAVPGSCLLPPTMAKIAEIDGDAEKFYELYTEYLLSEIPTEFIAVILAHLHMGGSMIFLTDCGIDEPWVVQLCNHFMNYYGIIIGSDGVLPGFNVRYEDTINNIIYVSGYISAQEYLMNKTVGFPMQQWIYDKLLRDLPLKDFTPNPYEVYEEICIRSKCMPNCELAVRFRRRHA